MRHIDQHTRNSMAWPLFETILLNAPTGFYCSFFFYFPAGLLHSNLYLDFVSLTSNVLGKSLVSSRPVPFRKAYIGPERQVKWIQGPAPISSNLYDRTRWQHLLHRLSHFLSVPTAEVWFPSCTGTWYRDTKWFMSSWELSNKFTGEVTKGQ